MAEGNKLSDRIYTADFVLLFVSFSLPFGWTMSGLPSSIKLACACWLITLGVIIHCIWVWTKKWNKTVRLLIVIFIPVVTIGFSWNPIKQQYNLQHHPQSEEKLDVPKEWYLNLKKVQVIPTSPESANSAYRIPFRIEINVNGMDYSLPNSVVYWRGEGISNVNEIITLPIERAKYLLTFQVLTTMDLIRRQPPSNWFNTNVIIGMSKSQVFNLKLVSQAYTNTLAMPVTLLNAAEPNVGYVEIYYDITTNVPQNTL